jgi:hypothetical protein
MVEQANLAGPTDPARHVAMALLSHHG